VLSNMLIIPTVPYLNKVQYIKSPCRNCLLISLYKVIKINLWNF